MRGLLKTKLLWVGIIICGLVIYVLAKVGPRTGGPCNYEKFTIKYEVSDIEYDEHSFSNCICIPLDDKDHVFHLHRWSLPDSRIGDNSKWFSKDHWLYVDSIIISGERIIKGSCQPYHLDTLIVLN